MNKGIYYIIMVNHNPVPHIYTSITVACKENGIPYSAASKGKRIFVVGDDVKQMIEATVVRIKRNNK